jgi:hypothetical protein
VLCHDVCARACTSVCVCVVMLPHIAFVYVGGQNDEIDDDDEDDGEDDSGGVELDEVRARVCVRYRAVVV